MWALPGLVILLKRRIRQFQPRSPKHYLLSIRAAARGKKCMPRRSLPLPILPMCSYLLILLLPIPSYGVVSLRSEGINNSLTPPWRQFPIATRVVIFLILWAEAEEYPTVRSAPENRCALIPAAFRPGLHPLTSVSQTRAGTSKTKIKEIATIRPHYGYRRISLFCRGMVAH